MANVSNINGELKLSQSGKTTGTISEYITDGEVTVTNPASPTSSSSDSKTTNYLNSTNTTVDTSTNTFTTTWNWKENAGTIGSITGTLDLNFADTGTHNLSVGTSASKTYYIDGTKLTFTPPSGNSRGTRSADATIKFTKDGVSCTAQTSSANPAGIYQNGFTFDEPSAYLHLISNVDWIQTSLNQTITKNTSMGNIFSITIDDNVPSSSLGSVSGALYMKVGENSATNEDSKSYYVDYDATSLTIKAGNGSSLSTFSKKNADNTSATTSDRTGTLTWKTDYYDSSTSPSNTGTLTVKQSGGTSSSPNPTVTTTLSTKEYNNGEWAYLRQGLEVLDEGVASASLSFSANTGTEGYVSGTLTSPNIDQSLTTDVTGKTFTPITLSGWTRVSATQAKTRGIIVMANTTTTNDSNNGKGISPNSLLAYIYQYAGTNYSPNVMTYWTISSDTPGKTPKLSSSMWQYRAGQGPTITIPSNYGTDTSGTITGKLVVTPNIINADVKGDTYTLVGSGLNYGTTGVEGTDPVKYTLTCVKYASTAPNSPYVKKHGIDDLEPKCPWSVYIHQDGQASSSSSRASGTVTLKSSEDWISINDNTSTSSNLLGGGDVNDSGTINNILSDNVEIYDNTALVDGLYIFTSPINKCITVSLEYTPTTKRTGLISISSGTISSSNIYTSYIEVNQPGENYNIGSAIASLSHNGGSLFSLDSSTVNIGLDMEYAVYYSYTPFSGTTTGSVSAFSPTSLTWTSSGSKSVLVTQDMKYSTSTKTVQVTVTANAASNTGLTNYNDLEGYTDYVDIRLGSTSGSVSWSPYISQSQSAFSYIKSGDTVTITCDVTKAKNYTSGSSTASSGYINGNTGSSTWTTSISNSVSLSNNYSLILGTTSGTSWDQTTGILYVGSASNGGTMSSGPSTTLTLSAQSGGATTVPISVTWTFSADSGISITNYNTSSTSITSSGTSSFSKQYKIYVSSSSSAPQYSWSKVTSSLFAGYINSSARTTYTWDSPASTTITLAVNGFSTIAAPQYKAYATGKYTVGGSEKTFTNTFIISGTQITNSNIYYGWSGDSSGVNLSSSGGMGTSSITVTLPATANGQYGTSRGSHTIQCVVKKASSSGETVTTITFTISRGTRNTISECTWTAHNS